MNDDKIPFPPQPVTLAVVCYHILGPTSLEESPHAQDDTEPDPQGHHMQNTCITLKGLTHSNFSLSLPLYPQTDFWNFSYDLPQCSRER